MNTKILFFSFIGSWQFVCIGAITLLLLHRLSIKIQRAIHRDVSRSLRYVGTIRYASPFFFLFKKSSKYSLIRLFSLTTAETTIYNNTFLAFFHLFFTHNDWNKYTKTSNQRHNTIHDPLHTINVFFFFFRLLFIDNDGTVLTSRNSSN